MVDLTTSIRRPRFDRSSHAPIPSITAASAVFVLPARSKAVRKAISSALGIVFTVITKNPSNWIESMRKLAAKLRVRHQDAVDCGPAIQELARRDAKSVEATCGFRAQAGAADEYLASASG